MDEYLVDLNATGAAIRAGYSEKSSAIIGWENLRKPNIASEIQVARSEMVTRVHIDQDFVLERWRIEALGEGPDTNSSSRIKAADSIAKHFGMWADTITGQNTGGPAPVVQILFANQGNAKALPEGEVVDGDS